MLTLVVMDSVNPRNRYLGRYRVVTEAELRVIIESAQPGVVRPGEDIQAAIDKLGTAGGVVTLGVGTHTITETLVLPANVRLTGRSMYGTRLVADTGFTSPLIGAATVSKLEVDNLTMVGTTTGINLVAVTNSFFHDMRVEGLTSLVEDDDCDGNTITNVK